MASIRSNVLANLVGRGSTALIYFAFVPVYIGFVGIEGYGLIGFFVTLLAISNALDLGLSATLNRELARNRAAPGVKANDVRDLVRSFEFVYWVPGLLIGVSVVALASLVAARWLQAVSLDQATLRNAVVLMGLVLIVQWPLSLYQGGLRGLDRQIELNVATVIMATVRAGGAALVLWLVAPTVTAFFASHLVSALVHTVVLRTLLWRYLPAGGRPRFRLARLKAIGRFATGLGVISLLSLAFTQLDKVLLARLVDLDEFGYYSLAALVAGGITYLVLPVFEALYPRFSALVASDEDESLTAIYHRGAQLVSVLVVPVASVSSFFARELVWAWTGSAEAARNSQLLVILLVAGTALNALMNVPYALMLAHGWTRLPIVLNLGAIICLLPLLVAGTLRFGAPGAAAIWLIVNAGYLLVGITLQHRRYLVSEKAKWVFADVLAPAAAAVGLVGFWRLISPELDSRWLAAVWMLAGVVLSVVGAALATAWGRGWVTSVLSGRRLLGTFGTGP